MRGREELCFHEGVEFFFYEEVELFCYEGVELFPHKGVEWKCEDERMTAIAGRRMLVNCI